MAFDPSKRFEAATEQQLRDFYSTLSEKDRRRFAAIEARQLGEGSIAYVAEMLGCSRRTIERGMQELSELPKDPAAGRVRRAGAGRKKRSRPTPQSSRT